MIHTPSKHVFEVACLALFTCVPVAASNDGQHKDLIRALSDGYISNFESFKTFKCKFISRTGYANSLDDALAAKLVDVMEEKGIWNVNGTHIRYEISCDESRLEQVRRDPGAWKDQQSAPGFASKFVTNGSWGYNHSTILNGGTLFQENRSAAHVMQVTPFNPGIYRDFHQSNPGMMLRKCERSDWTFEIRGRVKIGSDETLPVYVCKKGGDVGAIYYFDIHHGFIPRKIAHVFPTSGKPMLEAYFGPIRECTVASFFPERAVLILAPDRPDRKKVRVVEVTELTVDAPPQPGDMEVILGDDARLHLENVKGSQITLRKSEKISGMNIEEIVERSQIRAERAKKARALPALHKTPAVSNRVRLVLFALLALIVFVSVLYARWKRPSRRA